MPERYRRVCVRGIIYKNGKLFCQQLKDKAGQPKDFWCTPGGGLELGESLTEGLYREMIEETGVEPKIGRLLFVQQFSDNNKGNLTHDESEQMEFFFHIENPEDYEAIDEQASHYDAEIAGCDFVDTATENILPKFLKSIDLQSYTSTDQPVYIYTEFNQ